MEVSAQKQSQTVVLPSPQRQNNIVELTRLIAEQTHPDILSALYTNRGSEYYQQQKFQWAVLDFEKALSWNHLNYAAYFNLFSVSIWENNNLQALKNLCCSLSCLYLMRGRLRQSESDINRCLKLADNNNEGRLLRALQYNRKGKCSLALNQIRWMLESEPRDGELVEIRERLEQVVGGEIQGRQRSGDGSQLITEGDDNSGRNISRRLICTVYDECSENQSMDWMDEIEKRVCEFNEVVNEVNGNGVRKVVKNHYNVFIINDGLLGNCEGATTDGNVQKKDMIFINGEEKKKYGKNKNKNDRYSLEVPKKQFPEQQPNLLINQLEQVHQTRDSIWNIGGKNEKVVQKIDGFFY